MATKNENAAAETVEKVKKTAEKAGDAVKKTAEKAADGAKETGKKVVEGMKETAQKAKTTTREVVHTTTAGGKKVEHNVTHVDAQSTTDEELHQITRGNATPFRILAIVLWILALGFEVLAILLFLKKITITYAIPNVWQAVIALALDLVCLIIGSQMWKKANHMDPASEKNKLKFWLQNNLGVIVAAVAFIPFIIIALTDKNASKQDKTIATIAAAIALAIGVLTGWDWNPVSEEQLKAEEGIITEDVYWTPGGGVYHTHLDCGHLANSVNISEGSVRAAYEAGKTRICKTCANKDNIELPENVIQDLGEEPEVVENAAD